MNKRIIPLLVLALFAIPFFFLGIQDTHPYGDDWAQYVTEGQNIAQGKPYYQSGYILNPTNTDYAPPQYPPGFPLLLAPLIARYGLALRPMLYLNTLFLIGALFAAYYYFRGNAGKVGAVCLSLILLYGSYTSELKAQVLSDIPCMFFVLLYLGLRERSAQLSRWRMILLCLIGAFVVLIRTQMLLLVGAELILLCAAVLQKLRRREQLVSLKSEPSLWLASGILLLFLLVNNVLMPAPAGSAGFYVSTYKAAFKDGKIWAHIGDNASFVLDLFRDVFYHHSRDPVGQAIVRLMVCATTTFGVLGMILLLRRKWHISIVFLALNCLLLLFTPMHQGIRYFLPVAPVFIWAVAAGIMACLPAALHWKPRRIAIASTLVFLALGYDDHEQRLRPKTEWCLTALDTNAYEYIRTHVPDSEIILFPKPRLLQLYTGKRTMNLSWNIDLPANRHFVDSMNAGYLLYGKEGIAEQLFYEYLRQPGILADSVQINKDYVLYRLKKAGA